MFGQQILTEIYLMNYVMKIISLLPRPRFEGFKKYPLYTFAKTWNESGNLELYSDLTTFKIALRNQLLKQLDPDE